MGLKLDTTEVRVRYSPAADAPAGEVHRLLLPSDGVRGSAKLSADVDRPGELRDALLAVGDVLASDLRFRARSRADYLAHLLSSGKKVSKAVWDAQKEFLALKYGEAAEDEAPLDPVVTVDRDSLAIEVFSTDESSYARLALALPGMLRSTSLSPGTTHLELAPNMLRAISRMRSYRRASLELAPSTAGVERVRRVPLRWLRAFSEVQGASTLPAQRFQIAPVDLYNVLLSLRMRKAKKPPRALRYELVPGERPRIVLEPWDLVIEGSGDVYRGPKPEVVRTFGRNRLNTLARLLPHAKRIDVHLAGAGLPAYYVLHLDGASFTLALSGWSESGWAAQSTFDLVAPSASFAALAERALGLLREAPHTLDGLATALSADRKEARRAVLHGMQRGLVVHELANDTYRFRALLAQPIDVEKIRFGSKAEEQAHRLLESSGRVRLVRVHDLGAEGTSIDGEIDDQQARRTYKTSFAIDREGRAAKASCTCAAFRRAGLREGPCAHMIALRLLHARELEALEAARGTEAGRKLIRAETRTLVRRDEEGSTTYRISLDDRQVIVRFGRGTERMRMQRFMFSSADRARAEYFGRLAELGQKRFIDATSSEQH